MTISTRNVLLSLFFATTVVACGGGGGGGGDDGGSPGTNPGNNPPGVPDVTLEQLNGTWLGTFDAGGNVRTMQLTAENGRITGISLNGTPTNLSGPITKVANTPRAFTFELRNAANDLVSSGTLLVDAGGSHLAYLDRFFSFGVIQKGATAVPTYAQGDLNNAFPSGDVFTTNAEFTTFTQRRTSSTCTAANATTTQCEVTITGGPARAAAQLTLDNPAGRYLGTYTDTPSTGAPSNGTTRVYLSPDKTFAAVWNCVNFSTGFPATCDFSTWKR